MASVLIKMMVRVLVLAANWRVFKKMGYRGWESLIPIYSRYLQFEALYGNGAKMFLMLIPFYGVYVMVKADIDLAHAFNRSTGFGWGLFLLSDIFICILGFGYAEYANDSCSLDYSDEDDGTVVRVMRDVDDDMVQKDTASLSMLQKLTQLYKDGALNEEEFEEKKGKLVREMRAAKGNVGKNTVNGNVSRNTNVSLNKLKEIAQLHTDGTLTDEEFKERKADLLKDI